MTRADVTDAVSAGLAGLAIAIQAIVVAIALLALVGLVVPAARRPIRALRESVAGGELWIAWLFALAATLGSLFFSEYAHFIPCRLCWFQRIAMYPMAVILLIGAIRRDFRGAALYALALPVLGAGVSIYHIYIENHPEAESAGCKVGAPCATKWIDKFGYITIPTLALTAFAAIFVMLVLAWLRTRPGRGLSPTADGGRAA
jgi:disulfide bond formation protein DsbB